MSEFQGASWAHPAETCQAQCQRPRCGDASAPRHGEPAWGPGPGPPSWAAAAPTLCLAGEGCLRLLRLQGACTGVSQETDGKTLSLLGEGRPLAPWTQSWAPPPSVAPRRVRRHLGARHSPA